MTNINHTVFDMTTLGDYKPIAGLGYNTIRKMSGKYADLAIGDIVEMTYDNGGVTTGIERLQVASMAFLSWDTLTSEVCLMHLEMNHGVWNSDDEFKDFIAECYGDIAGDDMFLVIYFR